MIPASTLACSWSLPGSLFLLTPCVISPTANRISICRHRWRHERQVRPAQPNALYRLTEESLIPMTRQYHAHYSRWTQGPSSRWHGPNGYSVAAPPRPSPPPRRGGAGGEGSPHDCDVLCGVSGSVGDSDSGSVSDSVDASGGASGSAGDVAGVGGAIGETGVGGAGSEGR